MLCVAISQMLKDDELTSYCSSTLNGLLYFLLVVPAQVRVARYISRGLSCSSQPEAREVVPVGHFPIKHGRLWGDKTEYVYTETHGDMGWEPPKHETEM